jgi:hypothetical protein
VTAARLPLVGHGDELAGAGPAELERAARLAGPGDPVHRGLLYLGAAFAEHGLIGCTPPGVRAPFLSALGAARDWASGAAQAAAVRRARSEALGAVGLAERRAAEAVRAADAARARRPATPIDEHADRVVLRYAALAAHYAAAGVLGLCDAVDDPAKLVLLLPQVAGALAYHETGLGAARSAELRARACEQADWEAARAGAAHHSSGALAVQLFHEFLGARWKDVSDGQRARLGEIAVWALAERES